MGDVAVTVLLFAGVAIQLLGSLGVILMREPLDRLHYAGVTTLAAVLLAAAVLARESFSLIGNKALALAAFILVTSPVLVHVTARAIRVAGREERR